MSTISTFAYFVTRSKIELGEGSGDIGGFYLLLKVATNLYRLTPIIESS
ncbi:MAG: hypothetical protein M3264_06515 [Thermoproteota archaeon]|nr:hypothetical protein [Thermoproteota archaeon]